MYDGDWRLSRARSRLVARAFDGDHRLRRSSDDRLQNRTRALGRYSLMFVNLTSEPCIAETVRLPMREMCDRDLTRLWAVWAIFGVTTATATPDASSGLYHEERLT